jgi:addiction module RelE/StbE family toxin
MAIVKWLPGALKDLKRLHEFIGQHSPVAASRAIDSLIESAESLTEFPEIGRPWELELDYRELFVKYGARGYVIRYRLIEDIVFIVRIWHTLENR